MEIEPERDNGHIFPSFFVFNARSMPSLPTLISSSKGILLHLYTGFPGGLAAKESTCNVGDLGSIPGLGRSPGEGKGYPLQYSGLENSMDCIVHGVAKSLTWLSDFDSLTHIQKTKQTDYGFGSCLQEMIVFWICSRHIYYFMSILHV